MARPDADGSDRWLVDLPPTTRQSGSALAVAAVVLFGFAVVAPFARTPLSELNALFPSLDAIVFVTDLVTAVLLLAQFAISRSRALLALATGYLFTALIVIPHALTFSGAFSPRGLLGAGPQTGSWLFIFWHFGFAAALLAYAVLRREEFAKPVSESLTMPAIAWAGAGIAVLVCGLTWLSTAGASLLPAIVVNGTQLSPFVVYPIGLTILVSAIALGVLWLGRRSVLDQWLMVVAFVSIAELAYSGLLPTVRFSLGFYAGRVFSLITSSIVLIVLLAETMRLYVSLARSNEMLQRAQSDKLMNLEALAASISHETRQPLAAMMANSEVAIELIKREPPEIADALSALNDVISDTARTSRMLEGIRGLFGKTAGKQEPVDVNEAALAALRALRGELKEHGVATRSELETGLPRVTGHAGQLQELMINLFHNAIEAMAFLKNERRILTVRTKLDGGNAVVLEVEDTGPGIAPESMDKIFDPFVTTKPTGMGLGLAICRMIVDRHGGRLSAAAAHPRGTVFRIILPERARQ